jgi:tetratricopeptide (TPR) repeat protein
MSTDWLVSRYGVFSSCSQAFNEESPKGSVAKTFARDLPLRRCYDRRVLRDRSHRPTPALDRDTGGSFTREEACRLLKIEQRQLRNWERQGLIPKASQLRFSDLLVLQKIAKLRSEKVHTRLIKQALLGLKHQLRDSPQAGEDVRVYRDGRRVRIQIGKQKMEPLSGQLLFDFDEHAINKLLQLPVSEKTSAGIAARLKDKLEADHWFERGLELEQKGAPFEQVIEAYRMAAELDPQSAGAMVNLGTVFFNGHAWADAERHYKKALAIEPNYPLAHFNLGNLYDEQGDTPSALFHYREALKLQPNYADAHYNLALLFQGAGDCLRSMRHWRAYLKLDSTSTWAQIARRELEKLEAKTVVRGGSRPALTKVQTAGAQTGGKGDKV